MESKNVILFDAFTKQQEFITAVFSKKYNFIMYGGAIRGGKTFAGLAVIQLLCITYPKSRWVIIRKDLPTIKRNLLPSWHKIKISNLIEKENYSDYTISFKNGSQIIFFAESFKTDKALERWRGLECNGFLFEEIQECTYESFQKAFERAGTNFIEPMPMPLILATCNPTQNWVKEKIYKIYEKNELPYNWLYINSKIYDNPYVPEDYINNIKNLDFYHREVFINGNWNYLPKTEGAFWRDLSPDMNFKNIEYKKNEVFHIVFDNNSHPYIAIQLWQVDTIKKQIKQITELTAEYPNNTATASAELVIELLNDYEYNDIIYLYADTTTQARNTIDENHLSFYVKFENVLKTKYNIKSRVGKSNPSVSLSASFINDIYKKKIDNWELLIDSSCKYSISDYISAKEDKDGKIIKEKETKNGITYEKIGHFSDCKRYFITQLLEKEYNKYKGRGQMVANAVGAW